jgi:NADPH-dependent curcumin reductase
MHVSMERALGKRPKLLGATWRKFEAFALAEVADTSSYDCARRMNSLNHQIRLAARPSGLPKRSDWELTTEPVMAPGSAEFVVAVSHLSIDPAMRRWIDTDSVAGDPVQIGAVMEAGAIGRVTASNHPGFAVGEHVYGAFGVQEFARSDGAGVTKLDPLLAPLPTYLGALGTAGLTAYFGLLDVGHPRAGDTVVVSGAAGAVGSICGQIAKIKGCRAIGIAGGPAKGRWIVEDLGFDMAIDYKAQDVSRALRDAAPDGVDVFFDNVGGEILDAVLTRRLFMRRSSRIFPAISEQLTMTSRGAVLGVAASASPDRGYRSGVQAA